MKLKVLSILMFSLTLSGCGILPERVAIERQVVWAKMGTPARIVDDRKIKILVKDSSGSWITAEASLQGMVALDEPTLEYFQKKEK
jgi:hypothetical protein